MNHLHTFDQYSILEKEGLIQKGLHKAKEILGLKSTFKVRYTVTLYTEEEQKDVEKEKGERRKRHGMHLDLTPAGDYTMNVNIRAVDEDEAEEVFKEKFEKLTKNMDPKPTVYINQIHRTSKPGKKEIEIPKIKD